MKGLALQLSRVGTAMSRLHVSRLLVASLASDYCLVRNSAYKKICIRLIGENWASVSLNPVKQVEKRECIIVCIRNYLIAFIQKHITSKE